MKIVSDEEFIQFDIKQQLEIKKGPERVKR